MAAYYNEFKPEAAAMLRQLIKDGIIADGEVDERSITEVKADELEGFTQCHFFAGIGGWSVALRLAGWPDERPVWTGSCPCQPFSTAGKHKGTSDERHLYPVWGGLIEQRKPPIVFGEQVASAISHGWIDGAFSHLEEQGYACGSAVLPACAVDAPHKRDRVWIVADGDSKQWNGSWSSGERGRFEDSNRNGHMADAGLGRESGRNNYGEYDWSEPAAKSQGSCLLANGHDQRLQGEIRIGETGEERSSDGHSTERSFWSDSRWMLCGDGKIRRIPSAESGICIVAHGVQHRTPLLHAFGNAIVPQEAARFIRAIM